MEAEQLGRALVEGVLGVHSAMQRTIADILRELDLTESLADAIWQLGQDGRPQSRRELAERLHCDPSNVTFIVDRLEERGLVDRVTDRNDRRVKAVSLTPAGASLRERLVAATAACPVFSGISKEQQEQLAGLLHACIAGSTSRAVG